MIAFEQVASNPLGDITTAHGTTLVMHGHRLPTTAAAIVSAPRRDLALLRVSPHSLTIRARVANRTFLRGRCWKDARGERARVAWRLVLAALDVQVQPHDAAVTAQSTCARVAQRAAVQSLHRELARAKWYGVARLRDEAGTRPLDHVVQRIPANTDVLTGDILDEEFRIGSVGV